MTYRQSDVQKEYFIVRVTYKSNVHAESRTDSDVETEQRTVRVTYRQNNVQKKRTIYLELVQLLFPLICTPFIHLPPRLHLLA